MRISELIMRSVPTALLVLLLAVPSAPAVAQMPSNALPSTRALPTAVPESVGMSTERLQVLDRAMKRYIDEDMIAGLVTLVARDGKVVHLSAQGHRYREEGDPMDPDDIFFIMSMTKPIASVALMILYEEGRFLLDDPIARYVPEYGNKEVLVVEEEREEGERVGGGPGRAGPEGDGAGAEPVVRRVPAERPITFRHILTHTAGVDPDRDLLTEDEQALLSRRTTLDETMSARAPLPLAFHPGDEWRYGSSTDYVAWLVERISGQRFDRFIRERILDPLGMEDTAFNIPDSKTDRVAAVYSPSGPGNTIEFSRAPEDRTDTAFFGGVYGLYSTAADYFRFAQMIANGGALDGVRILSPSTVNLMTTNHIGDKHVYIRGPDAYGFGLGFSMLVDPARARESLTPGSFGWGGAWGTVFWIDPAEETVMILMTQISSYSHFNLRQDFPNLVMQAITESRWADEQPIRAYTAIPR